VSAFAAPVVDNSPYVRGGADAERAAVVGCDGRGLPDRRFHPGGRHDVPTAVADGLVPAMDSFFAQSLEVKKAWRTPPEVNRGHSPPKSESLSLPQGVESPGWASTPTRDRHRAPTAAAGQPR
jgi:hypothetical protein